MYFESDFFKEIYKWKGNMRLGCTWFASVIRPLPCRWRSSSNSCYSPFESALLRYCAHARDATFAHRGFTAYIDIGDSAGFTRRKALRKFSWSRNFRLDANASGCVFSADFSRRPCVCACVQRSKVVHTHWCKKRKQHHRACCACAETEIRVHSRAVRITERIVVE